MGEKRSSDETTTMLSVRLPTRLRDRLEDFRVAERKKLRKAVHVQDVVAAAVEEYLKKRGA